jgi:CheY-like chemotaxis protein/anti-sigma regulatory factor (Ser/Thr protein kinase)
LQQVLFNLLDNAVKFTDSGFVTIAAQVSESKQSDRIVLEFRIMDTGPGIAPAQINTIFEPFRQLHNGSKKEGAGLGLSLVKAIVEQQNGRIRVESKVGEGTSFFVTLPFQRVSNRELAASAEIKTKQTDVSLVGMDVLLVEDNPFGKKLYSRILKSWSCNVTTASTAAEVIEYTANHNYDAILMDVNLPGADGIALAKSIRKTEDHPNQKTPIIAFSAYQLSAEQALVFDATVSKTSSVHDIRAALENFAGSAAEHPLIDLSNLLSFCDGDKRFAAEMIEMFLQDSPEALRQLHTSVRAADWRWTYQLVHRLKTNLHTLGMPELEKLAEDIEQEVSVYPVEGQAVVHLTEQLLAKLKIADRALRHELEIMNH